MKVKGIDRRWVSAPQLAIISLPLMLKLQPRQVWIHLASLGEQGAPGAHDLAPKLGLKIIMGLGVEWGLAWDQTC